MSRKYRDHVWTNYSKNIIAADARSAVFLASFLNYLASSQEYTSAIEIVDLQKYKVVKQQQQIRITLRDRIKIPFIFVVGKN